MPFFRGFTADFNKFLEVPRLEVSFAAKIEELRLENVRLSHEIRKLARETTKESERRQTADSEASRLKAVMGQLHVENVRLEKDRSVWKQTAEESESKAIKYHQGIWKILVASEEVKSELPSNCIV